MITNKEFAGKQRIIIECRKDILFVHTSVVNGTVLVSFCDTQGTHDLEEYVSTEGKTWDELDPKVLLDFNNPKSISNLIDILQDAKKTLEENLPKKKDRKG